MSRRSLLCITLVAAALVADASLAQGGSKLYLRGKPISRRVRVIDGVPYAPVGDLAKAMGMVVGKKPDGYALVAAGGANELNAKVRGKIGDDLFTGEWRFKVLDVKTPAKYTTQFRQGQSTYEKGDGTTLVVVPCRLKNGNSVTELVQFANAIGKSDQAVLTDEKEHSYEPLYCDVHLDYYSYAAHVLPGAAIDFAMIFSIPNDATPKDLIYRIMRYGDSGDPKKITTVRVSLPK